MDHNFNFNPRRDRKPVSPDGYVDLKQAFVTGSVPSSLDVSQLRANMIEEPDSIMDQPDDQFDVARLQETVRNYSADDSPSNGE